MTGRLITFEGGEGAGKSTQIKELVGVLKASGQVVMTTREPGGSVGAEAIRELLVAGAVDRWDAVSEALLVLAARRDHVERTIKPALADDTWVLCDRFTDSTAAYQGAGHGLGRDWVARLTKQVLGDFAPDLTLILDIPVEAGLARAKSRGGDDRFERMDRDFHARLRAAFLEIAAEEPDRCAVIKADRPQAAIATDIQAVVGERLGISGLTVHHG
jgi:dTMP kinase